MTVALKGSDRATDSWEEAKKHISKLTESSGSRFRRKTIFAVCCSYIESNDYGVNKNMSLFKDEYCRCQSAEERRKDARNSPEKHAFKE